MFRDRGFFCRPEPGTAGALPYISSGAKGGNSGGAYMRSNILFATVAAAAILAGAGLASGQGTSPGAGEQQKGSQMPGAQRGQTGTTGPIVRCAATARRRKEPVRCPAAPRERDDRAIFRSAGEGDNGTGSGRRAIEPGKADAARGRGLRWSGSGCTATAAGAGNDGPGPSHRAAEWTDAAAVG